MNVPATTMHPSEADSTPSAICFPTPTPSQLPTVMTPLDRALGHLRRAKRELEDLAVELSQMVLMAYTTNESLASHPNLNQAVVDNGGKGILTPPFTPDAVVETFASALNVPASDLKSGPTGDNSTFSALAQFNFNPTIRIAAPSKPSLTPIRSQVTPISFLSSPLAPPIWHDKPLPPLPTLSMDLTPAAQTATLLKPAKPPTRDLETPPQSRSESLASEIGSRRDIAPQPTGTPVLENKFRQPPPPPFSFPPESRCTPAESADRGLDPLTSGSETSAYEKPPRTASFAMSVMALHREHQTPSDPIAEYFAGLRRRSVDNGGLALALKACQGAEDDLSRDIHIALGLSGVGAGWGWGGWDGLDAPEGPMYAELLCDMFVQTQNTTEVVQPKTSPVSAVPVSKREDLIRRLSLWKFEPHLLSSDELLEVAVIIFEALFKVEGMTEDTGIAAESLGHFLHSVRKIYHSQNKYHNFQHAVDVLQAMYSFLVQADCVPPVMILLEGANLKSNSPIPDLATDKPGDTPRRGPRYDLSENGLWSRRQRRKTLIQKVLDNRDLLVLCIAAIGHDVAHPGLSNAFQKNARTPLSIVYDDKSALEQMHCQLLLNLMRNHGLRHLIDSSTSTPPSFDSPAHAFRQLLVQTVLITDMGLHFDWMNKIRALGKDIQEHGIDTAASRDDVKLLICQALIKCGDISNPTRPHSISEHWSTALLQEWACQAVLERELGLPVSVVPSANQIGQAKGQVGFIDLFTKPLFDATAVVVPSMDVIARRCDSNRVLWQQRLDSLMKAAGPDGIEANSIPVVVPAANGLSHLQDRHYRSVFPLSLPGSLLAPLPIPLPDPDEYVNEWRATSSHTPDNEDDTNTPTIPNATSPVRHRATRHGSSVSSISSTTLFSPFSPTGMGLEASTAGSSPASQVHSLSGEGRLPPNSPQADNTTPMRAVYNASVRRKKSFHRQSWDHYSMQQRASGIKEDKSPPAVPPLPNNRTRR